MRCLAIATLVLGALRLGACDSNDTSPSDTVTDTVNVDSVSVKDADSVGGEDADTTGIGSEDADTTEVEGDTTAADTAPEGADVGTPAGTEVDSKKAAYHVWFDGPSRARAGVEIKFTVTVLDLSNAPVAGLALAPTYIHAEMGHGGLKTPSATELGAGVYEVANLVASMAGTWEFKVALPNADSARVAVTVTP